MPEQAAYVHVRLRRQDRRLGIVEEALRRPTRSGVELGEASTNTAPLLW